MEEFKLAHLIQAQHGCAGKKYLCKWWSPSPDTPPQVDPCLDISGEPKKYQWANEAGQLGGGDNDNQLGSKLRARPNKRRTPAPLPSFRPWSPSHFWKPTIALSMACKIQGHARPQSLETAPTRALKKAPPFSAGWRRLGPHSPPSYDLVQLRSNFYSENLMLSYKTSQRLDNASWHVSDAMPSTM